MSLATPIRSTLGRAGQISLGAPPAPPATYNEAVDALGSMVASHWTMPASGTTVTDRKGLQNATLSGTIQYLPVPIVQLDTGGRAIAIGAAGGRMTVPSITALNATSGALGLTFQCDQIGTTQQVLMGREGNPGGMAIEFKDLGSGMQLRGYRFDGASQLRSVVGAIPSIGDAHTVFMTWGAGGLVLYVDGNLIGSDGTANWTSSLSSPVTFLDWPAGGVPLDGCAGHMLLMSGSQPTEAQIDTLSAALSIAWAVPIDAGSVSASSIAFIDPKVDAAHYKQPIVPAIIAQGSLGTASVSSQNLQYTAGTTAGNNDTFTYRFTSANGQVSNTEVVTIDVTAVTPTGLTLLGSWPMSETTAPGMNDVFADTTGASALGAANNATLAVPTWTIPTHEKNRPSIVTGSSDASLEVSNGGPAIPMVVGYRKAAMSFVLYVEPYGELRGSQHWNEADAAFGREVLACCDPNVDAASGPRGSWCIFRRRTAWDSTTWRLGGYVRDAAGARVYFGPGTTVGNYQGISGTNLLPANIVNGSVAKRIVLTMGSAGARLWLDGNNVSTLTGVTEGWTLLTQAIHLGCTSYTGHANRRSGFWGRLDQAEVWEGQIDPTSGAGSRPTVAQSVRYKIPAGAVLFNVATYAAQSNPVQAALDAADAASGSDNWVYQNTAVDTTWYQQPYRDSVDQTATCRGMIGVRIRRRNGESTTVDTSKTCADSMFAAEGFSVRQFRVDTGSNPYAAQGGYTYIGCQFDGNARGQSWSSDRSAPATTYCGFNMQQAHLIYVQGNETLTNSTTATFDSCDFYDNSGDGISQGGGTLVTAKGCRFYGTYRGPFVQNNLTHNDTVVKRCESFESAQIVGGRIDNGGGLCDIEPFDSPPIDRNFWEVYDYWAEGDLDDLNNEVPGENARSHYFNVHMTRAGLNLQPDRNNEPCSSIILQKCTLAFYRQGFVSSPSGGGNWPRNWLKGLSPGVSGLGALFDECVFLACGRPACLHQYGRSDPFVEDLTPKCQVDINSPGSNGRLFTMRNCEVRSTRLPTSLTTSNKRFLIFPSLDTSYEIELDGLKIGSEFATTPMTMGGVTVRHRLVVHEGTGSTTPWSGAGASIAF